MADWVNLDASEVAEFAADMRKAAHETRTELAKGMSKSVMIVEREAKASMRPGTGREYRKPGGKMHRASVPGQPPAPDSGVLRSSVYSGVEFVADEIRGFVGSNLVYAIIELGTRWVKARPYLMPALNEKIGDVTRNLASHMDKVCAYITRA